MSDTENGPMTDEITLIGTNFEVSAAEKITTGEYQNYQPHAKITGTIPHTAMTEANREIVGQRLLDLHRDLQAVVERAAENRTKDPDFENWTLDSFGDTRVGEIRTAGEAEPVDDDGGKGGNGE